MCEYCEGKKYIFDNMKHTINYYDLYPSVNNTGIKLQVKDDNLIITQPIIQDIVKIHYCPMCGAKLNKGE